MGNRCEKVIKKEKACEAGIDTYIERLKKVRALNCDPSDIGLGSHFWKRLSFNSSNIFMKFF